MFLFVKQEADVERAAEIYDELTEKIDAIKKEEATEELEEEEKEPVKELPGKYANARKKVQDEKKKFGVETIRVRDIGVYQINLDALMKGKPVVLLSKGGSYIISLPSVFGRETEVKLSP